MNQVYIDFNTEANNSRYQDLIYQKPEERRQIQEYSSNSNHQMVTYPFHNGTQHTKPMSMGSLKLPVEDELDRIIQNGEQKVRAVDGLKLPGTADGYSEHFSEIKRRRINVADNLKLPGQVNNPLKVTYFTLVKSLSDCLSMDF